MLRNNFSMLNELFLLQIMIITSVFFLFWTTDVFSTILISVLYLGMISTYSFLLESDIITSFLIIIDLGVFLVMFSFMLHLSKFLQVKNYFDYSIANSNKISSIFFLLLFLFYFVFFDSSFKESKILENSWFFFISYYDFYSINSLFINSDLQLLKETYFHINNFEFFIVSIAVYIGLITAYIIFKFSQKFSISVNQQLLGNMKLFNSSESSYFFKYQDIVLQSTTIASSKVWAKKKKWY